MRLYDFTFGDRPKTLAVSVGDSIDPSPIGEFRVRAKRTDPVWTVPESIRLEKPELPAVVSPGPENPLGNRWMTVGTTSYGIHGTNNRWSIGRMATHGCIRLYNDDMQRLFEHVEEGTRIRIVYQTVKIGRRRDVIFLEAHPDIYERDPDRVSSTMVRLFALGLSGLVDRERVQRTIDEARGIPVEIGSLPARP
jgi:L,D-transpeptidase ErfK/SrfK